MRLHAHFVGVEAGERRGGGGRAGPTLECVRVPAPLCTRASNTDDPAENGQARKPSAAEPQREEVEIDLASGMVRSRAGFADALQAEVPGTSQPGAKRGTSVAPGHTRV